MAKLQSKIVPVEGYGDFEIREPLFEDIEAMFDSSGDSGKEKTVAMSLIKKCIYKDDKRVFDEPVGAALGMKLLKLAPDIMAMIGMDADTEKKD